MPPSKNQQKRTPDSKVELQTACVPCAISGHTVAAKGLPVGIAPSALKKTENATAPELGSATASPSPTPLKREAGKDLIKPPQILTRQRRWQIKKAAEKKCIQCGQAIEDPRFLEAQSPRCPPCVLLIRNRARARARAQKGQPIEGPLSTKTGAPDRRGRPTKYPV
jgi:hypothetical protein